MIAPQSTSLIGSRPWWREPHWLAAIAALVAFLPILWLPYSYDAKTLPAGAPEMGHWGAVADIFSTATYNSVTRQYSWRPLTVFTYLFDINLFGLRAALTNAVELILHALVAALVARMALALGASAAAATGAGVVFAVHPIVTEAVNCGGYRGDLMATAALIGATLAASSYLRFGQVRAAMLTVLLLLAGLASKESAAAGVILIPLVAMVVERVGGRQIIARRCWATFGMCAGASAIFFFVWSKFHYATGGHDRLGGSLPLGVANFLRIFIEIYMPRWLVPTRLRVFHELDISTSPGDGRILAAVVICAVLLLCGIVLARRSMLALVGLVWIVVTFGPVSQLVAIPDPVAERFMYMPHVGFALLIAGLWDLLDGSDRRGGVNGAIVAVACLTMLTWARHWDWRDERSLNIANFSGQSQPSQYALESLAVLYLARNQGNDFQSVKATVAQLLQRFPESAEGHRIAALTLLRDGDGARADSEAQRAVELAPASALAWRVLARCARAVEGEDSARALQAEARARELERGAGSPAFLGQQRQFQAPADAVP